jgi:hypothetical protein
MKHARGAGLGDPDDVGDRHPAAPEPAPAAVATVSADDLAAAASALRHESAALRDAARQWTIGG